jgi:hypothetical protein
MVAVVTLGLSSVIPAVAAPETRAISIVLNSGSTNSGTFSITLGDPESLGVQMYLNGVEHKRLYSIDFKMPVTGFMSPQVFDSLAPGDVIYACLENAAGSVCSDPYKVPGGVEPPVIVDSDGDGLLDDVDQCDDTPPGVQIDNNGCTFIAPQPVDADGDGVYDNVDQCLGTPVGTIVDVNTGCAVVSTSVTVNVKQASLSQGCPAGQEIVGAHFVITQIGGASPGAVSVTLSNGSEVTAGRTATTGGTAHYNVALSGGVMVTNASAVVPSNWAGEFNLSDYRCGTPVPPATCPEGTEWTDDNEDGIVNEGECCEPVVVATCPEGTTGSDANENGVIDEGECTKDESPVVVPPVVVPPVVTPPVVTPPVETPTVETPVVVPPVVVPPAVVPAESPTDVDETNGRGVTAETAAADIAGSDSSTLWANLLILSGLVLIAGTVARRRMATK